MVRSRGLVVLVAVALGIVAAVCASLALRSAPAKAFNDSRLTSVYVLRGDVARDSSGAAISAEGLISTDEVPVRYVPAGAVTNLSTIDDQVTASDLTTGQVVVRSMFVAARQNPGGAAQTLASGDVAVSVSVDPAAGVGGAIQPGDRVDILVDVAGAQEDFLYRSVPVLAVGTKLVPTPGSSPTGEPADVITFAMSPAAAAHIPPTTSATGPITQGVYLALEPPGSQPESVTAVSRAQLIPGFTPTTTSTTTPTTPGSSTGGTEYDSTP
jgi:Flp pilus assembly protein CpaB